ncbi:MAG: aminotransferase class V-fold PLP-dependent enzyme [Clostridia bacterium]|nr:aminotransferase class V-fold PLP-dependent enzyme [Clostridia bacterium]
MIYLDNAATTYPKPEIVYEVVNKANRTAFNTGRGSYKEARKLTLLMDTTRERILKLNDIKDGKVVFTSSATLSLNSLLFGINFKDGDNVYISPFEHNAVIRPLEELKKKNKINIFVLPFKKDTWELDKDMMINMFALNNPTVIVISHVSNATGFILPYEVIFDESKKFNSLNILDSAQGYGIISLKEKHNMDYIVFAGHKSLYGSFGIAGYIKLGNDKLNKTIFGGTGSDTMNREMHEYEAGSPNIVAIQSIHTSIEWLEKTEIYKHEKTLTNYLVAELKKLDKCKIYIPNNFEEKIFGIISINIDGYSADDVGKILDDEFEIYVRTGYHCAPLVHDFISSLEYNGTIRISLGYFNTKEEIDNLISALKSL